MAFSFGQLKPLALGALLALGASAQTFAADASLTLPGSMSVGSGSIFASGGNMSLSLGTDFMNVLDVMRGNVTAAGTQSKLQAVRDTDGFWTQVTMSAPVASLTLDTTSHQITTVSTAAAGLATISSTRIKSVSSGGQLTISDLSVNLDSKVVSGTVTGGNGVGTLQNIPLLQAGSMNLRWLPCAVGSACADTNPATNSYQLQVDLNNLLFLDSGAQPFIKGLGLVSLGRAAFQGMQSYYSDFYYGPDVAALSFNVDVHMSKDLSIAPNGVAIVPEPELVTMAAAGLLVAGAALRRRARTQAGSKQA